MSDVRVRAACAGDLDGILALGAKIAEASQWTRQDYEKSLTVGAVEGVRRLLLVAEAEGTLVGFAAATCVYDLADLENVAVAEAWRRKGLGRAFCDGVVRWAKESGAEVLMLEVRSQGIAARALYSSMGFEEDGLRRNYYRAPVDDAVLMRLELTESEPTGHL